MAKEKSKKVDGRKNVHSKGIFPYKLKEALRQRIIAAFLERGESVHSRMGFTIGTIIEHCIKNDINFILEAYPKSGYRIIRKKD